MTSWDGNNNFQDSRQEVQSTARMGSGSGSRKWLMIVLALLVVLLIAAVIFLTIMKKDHSSQNTVAASHAPNTVSSTAENKTSESESADTAQSTEGADSTQNIESADSTDDEGSVETAVEMVEETVTVTQEVTVANSIQGSNGNSSQNFSNQGSVQDTQQNSPQGVSQGSAEDSASEQKTQVNACSREYWPLQTANAVVSYCDGQWMNIGQARTDDVRYYQWNTSRQEWVLYKGSGHTLTGFSCYDPQRVQRDNVPAELQRKLILCDEQSVYG